jgi:hypothetical protein
MQRADHVAHCIAGSNRRERSGLACWRLRRAQRKATRVWQGVGVDPRGCAVGVRPLGNIDI